MFAELTLQALLWPSGMLLADSCTRAGPVQLRNAVTLTAEERAWVSALPVQRVGVLGDTAPLLRRTDSDTFSGISVDAFCFIAGELGLRYQLIDSAAELDSLQQQVSQGTLDMLMPLSRQLTRESLGLFTKPYFSSHYVVVSRKSKPYTLETLIEHPDFRIGVIAQSALYQDLAKIVPAQNLLPLLMGAGKQAFYQTLRSGMVDALVVNKDIFTEDKYRDEMFDLEVSQILTQFPRQYGFFVSHSSDHERLVELFDRYLSNLDTADATLRHETGERLLIERYLHQQDHLGLQRTLMILAALSLLLLLAYIRHYRRLSQQLKASHRQVLQQQQALVAANQQLEHLSMTDGLTGLANRRCFDERSALVFAQHKRAQRPLCVLMLDLDYFKAVNDQLGHATGDEYLRQVSDAIASLCRRPTDLLARYGGEELICLLAETPLPKALAMAETMRNRVLSLNLPNPGSPLGQLTLSIGVAHLSGQHANTDSLLAEADAQLYQAKHAGRNQVCYGQNYVLATNSP